MKEATGELNATVVVVLAVGILIAFFYYTIWPIIKYNFEKNTQCSNAICDPCPKANCETVNCWTKGSYHKGESFECVFKG